MKEGKKEGKVVSEGRLKTLYDITKSPFAELKQKATFAHACRSKATKTIVSGPKMAERELAK